MLTAFVTAILCTACYYSDSFPLKIIGLFAWVWEMFFHEFGHAITGWLLGYVSAPIPMITFSAQHSWTVQIIVSILLLGACIWVKIKKSNDLFQFVVAFTILIIALGFSGYGTLIITYMGHGGCLLFGGFFQYRAWVFKDPSKPLKQWFFAWLGFLFASNNIYFCYELIHNPVIREKYNQPEAFGVDADFIVIAAQTPFTVETIAAFTIGLGVIITITAFLLALFSFEEKQIPTTSKIL